MWPFLHPQQRRVQQRRRAWWRYSKRRSPQLLLRNRQRTQIAPHPTVPSRQPALMKTAQLPRQTGPQVTWAGRRPSGSLLLRIQRKRSWLRSRTLKLLSLSQQCRSSPGSILLSPA